MGARPRRGRVLVLLLVLLALVWHTLYWYPEINDDAYISFRYARNLTRGDGLTYNPGERVEGFSNLLWVLLLAAPVPFGATDLGTSAKLLGLLCSCGTLLLVPFLFRRLYPGLDPWWALLPAALLAFNPYFASWTTRGMETPLFTALLTASVALHAAQAWRTRAGFAANTLLWWALALTRPEGMLFLVLPAADALAHRRDRGRAARLLALVSLAALLYGLFVTWRWFYFGELVPNTFLAKVTYGLSPLEKSRGARYVLSFLLEHSSAFTVTLILATLAAAVSRSLPGAAVIPAGAGLFYAWYVNGDWMDNYRFMVPLLPFMFIFMAGSLAGAAARLRGRRAGAVAALAVLALAAWQASGGLRVDSDTRSMRVGTGLTLKKRLTWWTSPWEIPRLGFSPLMWEQTRWIVENSPPGARTAFSDIGFLGWVTDARIYDTQGLVNRGVARLFHRRRLLGASLNQALVDDFLAAAPEHAFLRRRRGSGEGVNQLEKALLLSPAFTRSWIPEEETSFLEGIYMERFARQPAAPAPPPEVRERRYLEAIRWSPRVPHLYAALRNLYLRQGETGKAESLRREARRRFPYANSFR